MLTHNSATVTKPLHIAIVFNEYFSSTAEKSKNTIKSSNKSFQDFLHPDEESLFVATIDAHKVNLIISALFTNKSTDPNSLPTKILKPLKNDISTHLADIVCLSIS